VGQFDRESKPNGFGSGLPASRNEAAAVLSRLPACREKYLRFLAASHSISWQPGGKMDEPLDASVEPAPGVQEIKFSRTDHMELCAQLG
jgi:hypothetical protein